MFAARPIIASDVGGIAAALGEGEGGCLVPPGDESALAAAMERLLTHPDAAKALGSEARRRAELEFSLESMVSRYVSLYRGDR